MGLLFRVVFEVRLIVIHWITHPSFELVGTATQISHQARQSRTAKDEQSDDHENHQFLHSKTKHRNLHFFKQWFVIEFATADERKSYSLYRKFLPNEFKRFSTEDDRAEITCSTRAKAGQSLSP